MRRVAFWREKYELEHGIHEGPKALGKLSFEGYTGEHGTHQDPVERDRCVFTESGIEMLYNHTWA